MVINIDDKLKEHEEKIVSNPTARDVPMEEVIADIHRYGSQETGLMVKAFLDNTTDSTRKASVVGKDGLVAYLGVGDHIYGGFKMGLISAHAPGISGSGGWGSIGTRRLTLNTLKKAPIGTMDPDKWLKSAESYVWELFKGKLGYQVLGEPSAKTILYTHIEKARSSLGKNKEK